MWATPRVVAVGDKKLARDLRQSPRKACGTPESGKITWQAAEKDPFPQHGIRELQGYGRNFVAE